MDNFQTVPGDFILRAFEDEDVLAERLTALQRAGMRIALGVGIVGTIVILALGVQWWLRSPQMPSLPVDSQQVESTKAILENYKTASDMALEGPAKIFDMVIVKILYPLFTLILGYIFGSRIISSDKKS